MNFHNTTISCAAREPQQLTRDPFARVTHVKRQIDNPPVDGCAWCGYMKRTPKSDRPFLYQYGAESETGAPYWTARLFCQQSCHRSFYS